jgi:hypothetical protein
LHLFVQPLPWLFYSQSSDYQQNNPDETTTVTTQNETQLQVKVLRKPLEKLLVCLSEPANLGATFNRLLFGCII